MEGDYWYVLFMHTGKEEYLAKKLNTVFSKQLHAFVPQKACVFRRRGQKSIFYKVCFPGYVFIESNKTPAQLSAYIFPYLYNDRNVYRFLNYGESKHDIAMHEDERLEMYRVLGHDYNVNLSKGFEEGDKIKITSGALAGNESRILKVNKNRNMAVINLSMFGSPVEVSVGLEIIERTK